jgi:outer membrane protein insertion porin family
MIKSFFKALLIILLLPSVVFAQIIENIVISGNKRISDNTIKVYSKLDQYESFNENNLNQILKDLYKTDFFKDINISIKDNVLYVDVVESPIIENLEINGIKKNDLNKFLLDNISLKNKRSFNKEKLQNDLQIIENILKSSGYYFSKISVSELYNNELNSVQISINVNLGKRAHIKNISFIGNKIFKDKQLREIIASEEHKFWKFLTKNVYINENLLNLDKRLLSNFYKNSGYYNIKINSTFVELDKDENFKLVYNIDAGNKFFFNNFNIKVPADYNQGIFDEMQKKFNKFIDTEYSLYVIEDFLDQINDAALLKQFEFIDASVSEEIVGNDRVDITINIKESKKEYVEKININGNYITIEDVVRNSLIVDEGDPFNQILFNKSLNNIRSLGIFKTVDYKISTGSSDEFKIIDVDVVEQPTGEIMAGAGYGTSGGTVLLGIKEKNFLGQGITLNANLELTEESIKGSLDYIEPYFNFSDNSLFASISNTENDYLDTFGYKTNEFQLSSGTSFEPYEKIIFSPNLSLSHENLDTNSKASNAIKKQKGTYSDIYFNYSLINDNRDNKFNPQTGNRTNFTQELPLYSDVNEISNAIEFTTYKKFSRQSDIVNKISIYSKMINSFDNDVRISKRLHVPSSRLRGFEKGKIGPIDNNDYIGGNYIAAFNLSTKLPNLLTEFENIDFSIFLDTANIWGIDYNDALDDRSTLRSSAGLAVNVLTPIGPLSFSFSEAFNKASSDKTETFRFNLGTTF